MKKIIFLLCMMSAIVKPITFDKVEYIREDIEHKWYLISNKQRCCNSYIELVQDEALGYRYDVYVNGRHQDSFENFVEALPKLHELFHRHPENSTVHRKSNGQPYMYGNHMPRTLSPCLKK